MRVPTRELLLAKAEKLYPMYLSGVSAVNQAALVYCVYVDKDELKALGEEVDAKCAR